MKKGLCTLTGHACSLETRYRAIRDAGFDTVLIDWANDYEAVPMEANLDLAARYGLSIENGHLSYKNINNIWLNTTAGDEKEASLTAAIASAGRCGVKTLVLHTTDGSDYPDVSEVGLQRYARLISAANQAGVRLAFENLRSQKHLAAVLDRFHDENVGFCYDSGHRHCRTPEVDLLSMYGDRLIALHLHDNDQSEDLHQMPFDGTMDWQIEMAGLKQSAYSGSLTLESTARAGESLEDYCRRAAAVADRLIALLTPSF